MESVKTDPGERELRQKQIEGHCRYGDSLSNFNRELCRELGPNAEAIVARLFEKHYPDSKDRKLWIRKWELITRLAKNRSLGL